MLLEVSRCRREFGSTKRFDHNFADDDVDVKYREELWLYVFDITSGGFRCSRAPHHELECDLFNLFVLGEYFGGFWVFHHDILRRTEHTRVVYLTAQPLRLVCGSEKHRPRAKGVINKRI